MGVVSNNRFDRVLLSIILHVQTLTLADVQTPFLRTTLVPLKVTACGGGDVDQVVKLRLSGKGIELGFPRGKR